MSFAVWLAKPPFTFAKDEREQVYQVGSVWVITDDPSRATQQEVDRIVNAKTPDVAGFINELKASMGGIIASNALAKAYPLFYPALQTGVWVDGQALIIDAKATAVLTAQQYAAFQALAAKYSLPLQLP